MNIVAADGRWAEAWVPQGSAAVGASPVEETEVVVIGAGQAGLSAAFHLQRSGLSHVVLDAERGPGGAWQHRWPSLTMATVNGIRELPGSVVPPVDPRTPARAAIPEYFAGYESQFGLVVRRPVQVSQVESDREMLVTTSRDGMVLRSRGLINATGTWTRPFWPHYPGAAAFRGRQLHTHDYRGPAEFDGARMIVIGGGISAVQLLMELAPHTAQHTWVTRRPPVWVDREFTPELGRAAVAMVIDRVSRGLPPRSVVSVTGLGLTPATIEARASGVLQREEMFSTITADGVRWADGRTRQADILFWCTGFRAALDHLVPLHLRRPGGGIEMDGTAVAADRRIHLVGYGPSASTIGANRAGRLAVRDLRRLLKP
ncbi:thioredoxin reductase [Nakamurella sp. UYEF19]|uniref:FAD-dependent oxidoreductase n=1 Tax=Nakamurella sp. UYEF19 TaxID=1756392 RepID=UPI00339A1924